MTVEEIKHLVDSEKVVRIYCGEGYMNYITSYYNHMINLGFKRYLSVNTSEYKEYISYCSKSTTFRLGEHGYLEIIYDYFLDNISVWKILRPGTNRLKRSYVPVVYLPFKKEVIDNYENNV